MAKRTASRKSRKHVARRKRTVHRRKTHRRKHRGGMAPVAYSLAGSWPSQMSLGQGTDYEQYHQGQHGGSAPYPVAVNGVGLIDPSAFGPAMQHGPMAAMAATAGMRDPPFDQAGAGRRRKGSRKSKKSKKSKKSRKNQKNQKQGGGGMPALGYDLVGAKTMLLPNQMSYTQAGLNPGYITGDVEGQMAALRGDKN